MTDGLRGADGAAAPAQQPDLDGALLAADAGAHAPPAWIVTRPGLPYFVDERGAAWTPIGQNDAVTWPDLAGLFLRRDVAAVEGHLRWLKAHGVTCLRVMLEYVQGEHRYLEKPAGRFVPAMVQFWDDLFALCEGLSLRLLLTPFDTFFLWRRWRHHPYHRANGGPCASRRRFLTCPDTRRAIKARLAFATERWGASPALFAWDLWNELKPQWAEGDAAHLAGFIDDCGGFLRELEIRLHGRAHPQTASVFLPDLTRTPRMADVVFRHPGLDFASPHGYDAGAIDAPRDTVAPARAFGRLVRAAIAETRDGRPVADSEHGPIRAYAAGRGVLPEAFDDAYFHRMQWAHLACGGAGGGLRWPYRRPHRMTHGMRASQRAFAAFLPLIDWTRFDRRPLAAGGEDGGGDGKDGGSDDGATASAPLAVFACASADQAVVWLLRTDTGPKRRARRPARPRRPLATPLALPGLVPGRWRVTAFDTLRGSVAWVREVACGAGHPPIALHLPDADLALALRRLDDAEGERAPAPALPIALRGADGPGDGPA